LRNDNATITKYSDGATLDNSNNVIERMLHLPGGVLLTKRAAGDVWSYPNIHGDFIATANASGVKLGPTMHWGPFGEALTAVPDNSSLAFDYGWHGNNQLPLEHQVGFARTIEMGHRQYDPALGRFLEADPIEGGSANAYDYVNASMKRGTRIAEGVPHCAHPVVRTHPATGRKALYVNRLMTVRIEDMPEAESEELLNFLFDHQEQRKFVYEHVWRVGDIVMWDNRCTLHARTDFSAAERRLMRRVTILGERPV